MVLQWKAARDRQLRRLHQNLAANFAHHGFALALVLLQRAWCPTPLQRCSPPSLMHCALQSKVERPETELTSAASIALVAWDPVNTDRLFSVDADRTLRYSLTTREM